MNVQHKIIEVKEERGFRLFGYSRMMRNNTIPKEWNFEGGRRKRKPREQWMNGVGSMISKNLTERRGERIVAEENFFGMKDTEYIVYKSLIKLCQSNIDLY